MFDYFCLVDAKVEESLRLTPNTLSTYSKPQCQIISTCELVCVCSVVSNCLLSHGLYPTRLLCPWDFPGKNTEVGSSGDLPDPGIEPASPVWQTDSLPLRHQGSPLVNQIWVSMQIDLCCHEFLFAGELCM